MGEDIEKGEVRQLIVEGGWWKASELPEEDLAGGDREKTGCLISEVVVRELVLTSTRDSSFELIFVCFDSWVRLARSRLLDRERVVGTLCRRYRRRMVQEAESVRQARRRVMD